MPRAVRRTDFLEGYAMSSVHIREAPQDCLPKCPHCGNDLDEIWSRSEGLGLAGKERVLICPNCRAMLGYGAWRR